MEDCWRFPPSSLPAAKEKHVCVKSVGGEGGRACRSVRPKRDKTIVDVETLRNQIEKEWGERERERERERDKDR